MAEKSSVALVTAIGTAAATTVVTELAKTDSFHIVGTDIFNPWEVVTSQEVDDFYRVPPAVGDEERFLRHILELCRQCGVNYYFATIDEEVASISRHKEEFEDLGVRLCVPNRDTVELCHDKYRFVQWCEERFPSMSIKRIKTLEEAARASYPLFLKPAFGRASIGCRVIGSFDELIAEMDDGRLSQDVVLQKYVEGNVVTVDVVRSAKTGQFKAIPRLETQRNANGCGVAVELFYDEDLISRCRSVAEGLGLDGVANMEFFKTDDGYKMIEVNPRLSAGIAFSCLAGADLIGDALRIADGAPLKSDTVRFGACFAKRYEVYELDRGRIDEQKS